MTRKASSGNASSTHRRRRRRVVRRLGILALGIALWTGTLCLRLYRLQVVEADRYRSLAQSQQSSFVWIQPRRGDILDSESRPLAVSAPVESLFAHPSQVTNAVETAERLAPILNRSPKELQMKLQADRPFVYLARKIPPQTAEKALELELAGIGSHSENRRFYPAGKLAAHLLGFVGTDNQGLGGLEHRYDKELRGRKARVQVRVDAFRRSYQRETAAAETQGNSLVLHLDRNLQHIVEDTLRRTVATHKAKSGAAILMDPFSGAVLAMASFPEYDPNASREVVDESFRNRSVLQVYEPGSTFKVVVLSAVLDQQLVDLKEQIDCTVGRARLANKVYREAGGHNYGLLDFYGIVSKSSNVGTIRLSLRMGEEGLYRAIRAFGFGEKTAIDLPGEETGILRPVSEWSRLSIGALSIGQEIAVTPLQIVRAASAVANGGFLVKPQLVRQIVDPQGRKIWEAQPERRRIMARETSEVMKQALSQVVERGTGTRARLSGYSSAGKTGTAQKIVNGVYSKSRFTPSYVGFAPIERPVLAGVVVIDEPRGEHYAGRVAAPAFQEMMERALIHLKVPRDQPERDDTENRRRRLLAQTEPRRSGGIYQEEVSAPQSEEADEIRDHIVPLGDEDFQLPDFSGMSLREVMVHANRLGLRLRAVGSGVAVAQRPRPGSNASPNMTFEVVFSKRDDKPSHATQEAPLPGTGGGRP